LSLQYELVNDGGKARVLVLLPSCALEYSYCIIIHH